MYAQLRHRRIPRLTIQFWEMDKHSFTFVATGEQFYYDEFLAFNKNTMRNKKTKNSHKNVNVS